MMFKSPLPVGRSHQSNSSGKRGSERIKDRTKGGGGGYWGKGKTMDSECRVVLCSVSEGIEEKGR